MNSKVFLKAVEIGVKHRFPHWDSTNVGILGIAIADLLLERLNYELYTVKFDDNDVDEILKKLMKISFIFLTRRLEVSSSNSHEVYMKRANLVQNYGAALFGEQVDCKEGIISDHYFSSLEYAEKRFSADAEEQMELAEQLFRKYHPDQKEEITIEEMYKVAELGLLKNYKLYSEVLKEYQESKLNIDETELIEYFNNNTDLVFA